MSITLPIGKMSREEKLAVFEAIWDDLSRDDQFDSPAWHAETLAATERQVAAGTETFSDWEVAKKRIRSKAARLK